MTLRSTKRPCVTPPVLSEPVEEFKIVANDEDRPSSGFTVDPTAPILTCEPSSDSATYSAGENIVRDDFASVYTAKRHHCNKPLAMHVSHKPLMDPTHRTMFTDTANSALNMSHIGILNILDYGFTANNKPFVVTEPLPGSSLASLLQEEGKFSTDRALRIFIQVCDALSYLSSMRSLVGDLAPHQIYIRKTDIQQEHATLVNVGLNSESITDFDGMPPSGKFAAYASPERCIGQELDERSIVYTIGCMLYEALSGQRPFIASDDLKIAQKHLTDQPAPLFKARRRENLAIEQIVLKCLKKEPLERYQSINELANQLQSLLKTGETASLCEPYAAAKYTWTTHPDIRVLLEAGIALFAILMVTLGTTHNVKAFNSKLNALKDQIQRAELTSCYTPEGKANWERAIRMASDMGQPKGVIADLEMKLGSFYQQMPLNVTDIGARRNREFDTVKCYASAMVNYEAEDLTYEADHAASQIIGILNQRYWERESSVCSDGDTIIWHSDPVFIRYTAVECRKYEPILRYIIKHNLASGIGAEQSLANILVARGRWGEAAKLLENAVDAKTSLANSYFLQWQLAECLKKNNELISSAIWFRRAMNSSLEVYVPNSDYASLGTSLTEVLEKLGRTAEAKDVQKQVKVRNGLN